MKCFIVSATYARVMPYAFSALTLLVGRQEGHLAHKKYGGWWRWALVSPDGVAPSRMVSVSASVNLPCTVKSRSSLLAPAHPDGPGKRAIKWLWCGVVLMPGLCVSATYARVMCSPYFSVCLFVCLFVCF